MSLKNQVNFRLFISIFLLSFFLNGLISCQSGNKTIPVFEKTIKFQKPSKDEIRYSYIPFDVPENTESLSIKYEYDKKDGANRIELGVFETGFSGKHEDKKGLRGWSGSVRDSIFIARDSATHGYSPGNIPSGKWHLVLGLASVSGEGVEVKVKVSFNQIDEKAKTQYEEENKREFSFKKQPLTERIKSGELTWFAGDLHTHTFHGDGRWSVRGVLESADSNNLDFVAITEHNTFTHHAEIEFEQKKFPKMLVLNGQEVTTYGGHINVWGLPNGEWVDFRVTPGKKKSAKRIASEAEKLGAIASINHPTMDCGGCNWTYGKWDQMASVEVWNATWDEQDEATLKKWDELLQKGSRITAIGSSDSHQRPEEPSDYPTNLAIGEPTVFIGAKELTKESLFEAIKTGRVMMMENSRRLINFIANDKFKIGDSIKIKKGEKISFLIFIKGFPEDSEVSWISSGKILEQSEIGHENFSAKSSFEFNENSYLRLEIRGPNNKMRAFTNPIYINVE